MEDVLRRLGNVEADVSELKLKVGTILVTIPSLATKNDVNDVKLAVADLRAEMAAQFGSVRADMAAQFGSVRTEAADQIGSLKASVAEQIGSLKAGVAEQIGSLKAGVADQIGSLKTGVADQIGSLRTAVADEIGSLRADMAARETAFIKWMIATVLAASGVAFTIAKFVH